MCRAHHITMPDWLDQGRAGARIPYPRCAIPGRSQDTLSIRAEGTRCDETTVLERRANQLSTMHLPDARRRILRAGEKSLPVRNEISQRHRLAVPKGIC